jgi:hypothetical protein
MKKNIKQKKVFGGGHLYRRHADENAVRPYLVGDEPMVCDVLIASLEAGVMKIEAVLFRSNGGAQMGYEVFVKTNPDSKEWICFDNPADSVAFEDGILEQEMFGVLDRAREENGLSFEQNDFKILKGKQASPKKEGSAEKESPEIAM